MRIAPIHRFPVAWTDPRGGPDWAAAGRPVPGAAGVCTSEAPGARRPRARMTAGSARMAVVATADLMDQARAGDGEAFRRLTGPHRRELQVHCYRMLGSVHDAEDALQETLLAAWRGLARFEGRSSLRSWLYTIATNTSLNLIARRPKRVLPIDYAPAADPHDGPGQPLVESTLV